MSEDAINNRSRFTDIFALPIELHAEPAWTVLGGPRVHDGDFAVQVTHVRQAGSW